MVLQRERLLPPISSVKFEQAAPQLEEVIRDRKLHGVAADVFKTLQEHAKIENVMNDPVKSKAMPEVAALINGQQITLSNLAEQCIERHGTEVLEGTINRQLIEQACEKRGVKVTTNDMKDEITRAAAASVPPKSDGSPDVDAWLKMVTEEQGISEDVYRAPPCGPRVALKKLAADEVKITMRI